MTILKDLGHPCFKCGCTQRHSRHCPLKNARRRRKHFRSLLAQMTIGGDAIAERPSSEEDSAAAGVGNNSNLRRGSRQPSRRASASDAVPSSTGINAAPNVSVDFSKLDFHTLKRYKKFFHLRTRNGSSKAELVEAINCHFAGQHVKKEDEVITWFMWAITALDEPRRPRSQSRPVVPDEDVEVDVEGDDDDDYSRSASTSPASSAMQATPQYRGSPTLLQLTQAMVSSNPS